MKKFGTGFTPKFISRWIPGKLIEHKKVTVNNVAELDEANESSVCFYQNKEFYTRLLESKAGLIFVPADFDASLLPKTNLFLVENPYINFMMLVQKWLEIDESDQTTGVHENAAIHETAKISDAVKIGAGVSIAEGAKIGSECLIEANCSIGKNVVIEENCHFFPGVKIYEDCRIGNNVILHSGVVIGADGFGFLLYKGKQFKLPQVGNVIIHDDVEIGANTCVDRATLGSTVIGEGTKIDNLVQIGHNCVIGEQSIICAQVGLAGNTRIGDRVYLAGQVGSADHVNIGNDVMVGAQSGVAGNVPDGQKVFGYPARESNIAKRIMISQKYLPELVKYFRKITKESK